MRRRRELIARRDLTRDRLLLTLPAGRLTTGGDVDDSTGPNADAGLTIDGPQGHFKTAEQ